MEAFSDHYQANNMNPFFHDSVFLQNHPINTTNCFSQFCPPEPVVDAMMVQKTSSLDNSDDNEPSSVTRKQSSESSTVVDKLQESGEQVTQKLSPIDKKRRSSRNGPSPNSAQSKDAREVKVKKEKQCSGEAKLKQQQQPKADKKAAATDHQEPPSGYIHVRARRGQATDSHSLAERVRREKIGERMKTLQRLVPGCDKVTGKALMLDEIINYVQSLQNQVQLLSLKLASVETMFSDFGMDQDSFIFRSPPPPPPIFADTTTNPTTTTTTTIPNNNNYPLLDSSVSVLLQQDNGGLFWDLDEQRQQFLNPYGFSDNNNLCSFNYY